MPWFKGTMVKDDNPNCPSPGQCHVKSWCCKNPNKGSSFCVTKPCSDIRLATPSEKQMDFFNVYIISVTILLIGIVIIKLKFK